MAVRPIDGDALKNQIRHMPRTINPDLVQYSLVQAIIADMPTLTKPNEWVSVEERLPEESDGMVLFTNGKAVTSGYRNYMFRMSDEEGVYAPAIRKGGGYMRVTHWMHLPAPPKKEG